MNTHSTRGLTLLEIIVVVVFIAILAVIFVPSQGHNREHVRRTTCGSNMGQIHKAITMYEVDYSAYPTCANVGKNGQTDGDAQRALNLLYRQYIDDVRVFSCPSNKLSYKLLNSIEPWQPKGWPGAEGTFFKEAPSGEDSGNSTSYGYSPGHTSENSRVIIFADRKGSGPKGNSSNHGKDAGQNVLSAGGSVTWAVFTKNSLGLDDSGVEIIDPDIFSDNSKAFGKLANWDTFCR